MQRSPCLQQRCRAFGPPGSAGTGGLSAALQPNWGCTNGRQQRWGALRCPRRGRLAEHQRPFARLAEGKWAVLAQAGTCTISSIGRAAVPACLMHSRSTEGCWPQGHAAASTADLCATQQADGWPPCSMLEASRGVVHHWGLAMQLPAHTIFAGNPAAMTWPVHADTRCNAPVPTPDVQQTLGIASHPKVIMPLNCRHVISGQVGGGALACLHTALLSE